MHCLYNGFSEVSEIPLGFTLWDTELQETWRSGDLETWWSTNCRSPYQEVTARLMVDVRQRRRESQEDGDQSDLVARLTAGGKGRLDRRQSGVQTGQGMSRGKHSIADMRPKSIYVRVLGYCVHLTLCHMTFHFPVFCLPCPAEQRGLPLVSRTLCWTIRGRAAPLDRQVVSAPAATNREVGWQAMGENGKQKLNLAYGHKHKCITVMQSSGTWGINSRLGSAPC